jgi:hypothetical protein
MSDNEKLVIEAILASIGLEPLSMPMPKPAAAQELKN